MTKLGRWTALFAVGALLGCGGKSSDPADPRGDGGSLGHSHGASSSGGASSTMAGSQQQEGGRATAGSAAAGSTASGGTVGSGVAGSAAAGSASTDCSVVADDFEAIVSVEIVNDSSSVVHLGSEETSCGGLPLFEVADADGKLPPLPGCRQPCLRVREEGPLSCVEEDCALPRSLSLEPGQRLRTVWDGLFVEHLTLPGACVPGPEPFVTCDRAKRVEQGTFTFSARAGSSLRCPSAAAGICGACAPSDDGGCHTSDGLIGGSFRTASTSVMLDADYGIPDPPVQSFQRSLRTVEIVFTD